MNELVSLSDLFVKKIFRIPDYQRGYAWGESQLDDFWDDIINLGDERNHYMGMLSLKELKKDDIKNWKEEKWIIEDKSYKPYHVVDGQQRLTTFIVFINSILKLAEKHEIAYINGEELATIRGKYIVESKKPLNIQKAYKFGYETDNPSFTYLRHTILGEDAPGNIQETFYTLNLERAKNYFDEQLERLYKEKGEKEIQSIFNKLVNRLQFNIHNIDDDFDIFVAFETMNNRGKKLSNLEILKNRLIYLTTIYKKSILSSDDKNKMREDTNDAWKEVYFELGRDKKKPLNDDEYLRNHWILFYKYSRTTGDDYIRDLLGVRFITKAVNGLKRSYTQIIERENAEGELVEYENPLETDELLDPIEIRDYVASLKSTAKLWYYSFNPEENKDLNDEEVEWVRKLNRIGINYYRPLVVASMGAKGVTAFQRIALFKVIEKSIFVFFRMARLQASYQSSVAYNFARELYKGKKNIDEITVALEENFKKQRETAVETFVTKIDALFKNHDGFYSWPDLRYFLFEYERSLFEKTFVSKLTDWNAFTKNEKDKISIEHILPQTPTKWHWRNQFRDYSDEEKRCLANSLGNLIALSQSVNSALQNDEYQDKKEGNNKRKRGYVNGSNSETEVANKYNIWNSAAILDRGKHLISFMEERWDFKFNEQSILKVLGLEFMAEERKVSPELAKPIVIPSRGEIDANDKDAIKVSDYLKKKDPGMVDLYNAFFEALCEKINGLQEHATKPYLAIAEKTLDRNIAQVSIQKKLIRFNILKPLKEELQIGEENGENYRWSLSYNVLLKTQDEIPTIVESVLDSYKQMLMGMKKEQCNKSEESK